MMKKKVNHDPIEDELDAIRIKLYEQTKDMTTRERVEFFNKKAREGLARHGITVRYAENPNANHQGQP